MTDRLDTAPAAAYRLPMAAKGERPPDPEVLASGTGKAPRVAASRLRRLIAFVADAEGARVASVDLAVVDAGEMAGLNRRWTGRSGPTDVLSFDLSDPGPEARGLSAQIVVSADAAAAAGPEHARAPAEELMLYVIHGLLHLLGYDDTTPAAAAKMAARQDELLEAFLRRDRRA